MLRSLASRPSPVLFACMFASQAGLLVLSPVLEDIAREFGTTTAAAGQLRTILGAAGGVAALSFAVLAVAQAVMGIGIGLIVAIAIAAAGEWAAPDERPKTLAWAIAGMPSAWVIGMPVTGAVASLGWRMAWLIVAGGADMVALALVWLRPADPPTRRIGDATAAWRRPEVARFTLAELLANAAWASVLTYSGALLIESYGASRTTVALVPGTLVGRWSAPEATPLGLAMLTLSQACFVAVLGAVRPVAGLTLSV